jgi:hypothetical protein
MCQRTVNDVWEIVAWRRKTQTVIDPRWRLNQVNKDSLSPFSPSLEPAGATHAAYRSGRIEFLRRVRQYDAEPMPVSAAPGPVQCRKHHWPNNRGWIKFMIIFLHPTSIFGASRNWTDCGHTQ